MRIREPRAGWTWFIWVWAAFFGGVPLAILVTTGGRAGDAPVWLLVLFPLIAVGATVPVALRTARAGFELGRDGIHGAHDAESAVVPWDQVSHLAWRWAQETSGVKVNGRPLPDGYALHAVLRDGREVRLMQRVAPRYGQQQDLNEQLARAEGSGALPVPFDATIPVRDDGQWSGTPPAGHTLWSGGDLPPPSGSPLDDDDRGEPAWPTG